MSASKTSKSTLRLILRVLALALVFVFVFSIEIRAKADMTSLVLVAEEALVQIPDGCWAHDDVVCAVRTGSGEKALLSWGEGQLALDQMTGLIRVAPNELRLLKGLVLVHADDKKPTLVRSEFGEIHLPCQSRALLQKDADHLVASSLGGDLTLKPRGSSEELEIPPGLQNWIGRVQSNGRAATGMPVAFPWVPSLKAWARVYSGSYKAFAAEVQAFAPVWTAAAEDAGVLHQELYQRKIASLEIADQRRTEELKRVHAHDRELVERFKHKVFDE